MHYSKKITVYISHCLTMERREKKFEKRYSLNLFDVDDTLPMLEGPEFDSEHVRILTTPKTGLLDFQTYLH